MGEAHALVWQMTHVPTLTCLVLAQALLQRFCNDYEVVVLDEDLVIGERCDVGEEDYECGSFKISVNNGSWTRCWWYHSRSKGAMFGRDGVAGMMEVAF